MFKYKNPFSDFDSNVMSSKQIADFFTEPYESFTIPESKIIEDKSPIIFIGGRGTGKTMLLRQFSYNVQKISYNNENYYDKIKRTKYIGVYFRVDKPLLQSLSVLGQYSSFNNFEESIFTHFFELTIFKEYLEIIKLIERQLDLSVNDVTYQEILAELKGLVPVKNNQNFHDLDSLIEFIVNQINYIWIYQSKKSIDIDNSVVFEPKCNLILQGRLSDEFCNTSILKKLGLSNTSILLLIDEFESFSKKQQMVINAAMRYNKDYGIRLRIGMRPYGFKTFDTVNSEDFIKEGRDYSKIEFDNPLVGKQNNKSYFNLIKKISQKRLSMVPEFTQKSIEDILGKDENIEQEAKEIVKGKTKHFTVYLKEINKYNNKALTLESVKEIRDENPLYEMECLRLLLQGESMDFVKKALHDYKKRMDTPEAQKFKNDYNNKYKLSFVFVLCSIYKREKKEYYGFSDYCYISSGIVGAFIELCRRAFDLAYFRDSASLENGKISKEIQTDAAYEFSYAERDMIKRISSYGDRLNVFINNIGNSFSIIHRDLLLRYPETNMFPYSGELTQENKQIFNEACKWSLVFKKPNVQTSSHNNIQEMFILSRVFSPVFKISYRTRGGINPIKKLTDDFFSSDFKPENVLKETKKGESKKKKIIQPEIEQLSIFE